MTDFNPLRTRECKKINSVEMLPTSSDINPVQFRFVHFSLLLLLRIVHHLKGPKHEIFESGFFTQIRGLWLGDLGTGEKN